MDLKLNRIRVKKCRKSDIFLSDPYIFSLHTICDQTFRKSPLDSWWGEEGVRWEIWGFWSLLSCGEGLGGILTQAQLFGIMPRHGDIPEETRLLFDLKLLDYRTILLNVFNLEDWFTFFISVPLWLLSEFLLS